VGEVDRDISTLPSSEGHASQANRTGRPAHDVGRLRSGNTALGSNPCRGEAEDLEKSRSAVSRPGGEALGRAPASKEPATFILAVQLALRPGCAKANRGFGGNG